ncbi:MAG: hypothetical protein JSS65_11530 [Armatimonadetes bacterium]|nr:hypothetical protein [Armatimonadota bacterium]
MKFGPNDAFWNREICSKQTERRIELGVCLLDIVIQILYVIFHIVL